MGKFRPRKKESASPEEVLSEDIGRKIVNSILDDKHGRFKVLVRGHSRKAIATYQEQETKLSLLQFAAIVGNVYAAEVLLGLGADKSITWHHTQKPGGWDETDLKWVTDKAVSRFCASSVNICDVEPPMLVQPLIAAQLSILHLAALANQEHMVSFLVNNDHLPVDVRAGGTQVTPLMAVATKRCSWLDGVDRYHAHTCGHPKAVLEPPPPGSAQTCTSMLHMFKLLLSLGADPAAVDICGCEWLAAAAAAGDHGLWVALIAEESAVSAQLPRVHAGQVLLRAAHYSSTVAGGEVGFFKKAADDLRRLYEAQGAGDAFVRQLNKPVAFAYVDNQGHFKGDSHALVVAMQGPRGAQVAEQLLDVGVSLDALRLDMDEAPINRVFLISSAVSAVRHAVQRGDSLVAHAGVVFSMFFNCCRCKFQNDQLVGAAADFEELLRLMHEQGLDFREERWWPRGVSCPGRTALGTSPLPCSPLMWAVCCESWPAICTLLRQLGALGDTKFISCSDPHGDLPLVAAAAQGDLRECLLLVDGGADIMGMNRDKHSPFWEAISRPDRDKGTKIFHCLLVQLRELLAQEDRRAAAIDFLHQPCYGQLTLAQWAAMNRADDALTVLAAIDVLQANLIYTGETPLRIVCQRPQTANDIVVLHALTEESNEALTEALTERSSDHGLTVLGHAVAWGHESNMRILADVCRREGLELAPLLERHVKRSQFHAPLFAAIAHRYPNVLEILFSKDMQLQLAPEIATEHLLLTACGLPRGSEFVREPRPGETESLSLLMCAASVGNGTAVKMLLAAGVDAREEPFPGNRWYKSALTAAIDFPDLQGFPGAEGSLDGSMNSMGRNQLACVLELLKAGGAMTEDQMHRVLRAVYHASDTQVGMDLFRFMSKRLAQCHHCRMVGCWRKCGGCRSTFYCSADCQAADWPNHSKLCRPPNADAKARCILIMALIHQLHSCSFA